MFKINSIVFLLLGLMPMLSAAQPKSHPGIQRNIASKTITLKTTDGKIALEINYSKGCLVKKMIVNGKNTLSASGAYTGYITQQATFTSASTLSPLQILELPDGVKISGINYGDANLNVKETWLFKVIENKIRWNIIREYNQLSTLEDIAFPTWNFASLKVWKGGIIDNGGIVWAKYLSRPNDTYGVHTGGITFWNAESGDGLKITGESAGNHLASKFAQSEQHEFTFTQLFTPEPLQQRYNLSRFMAGKFDVFAAFKNTSKVVEASIDLQYVDYFKAYSKGNLPGIDATAVRELMNTTGRYGVVDNNIIGANGWLTNWKCLHEPFFAQIGMALNDANYTRNMSATLDQERDLAMLPDGRVLSRWHNVPGDEIPGTYDAKTGYYEAMWGYTIDSQTSYVINASEQFDLSGDLSWLRKHQLSCEKALDWLIKRDSNQNGIFEMKNNGIADQKASDWLDIVWASFENSFVNAQMYEALNLWSHCERTLGNEQKAIYYASVAKRLKTAFNKPVAEGGFWSPEKQQYVYWRDRDGSVHGNNLVTPVNFAAIAFGICDDPSRIKMVLDQIEKKTKAEHLFHWPLCFESFEKAEVEAGNWPFPRYENGDIFPTWGYLGVRAYAKYDNNIALAYISNLLNQYNKDGLSSQRYSRKTQLGLGDDVLAGISTSVTALYRDIYGVRPKWNRMGLEPNMNSSLDGTEFSYNLRDVSYLVKLNSSQYQISAKGFQVVSNEYFGVNKSGNKLIYYPKNKEERTLEVSSSSKAKLSLIIDAANEHTFQFKVASKGSHQVLLSGLKAEAVYQIVIGNKTQTMQTNKNGTLVLKSVKAQSYRVLNYRD